MPSFITIRRCESLRLKAMQSEQIIQILDPLCQLFFMCHNAFPVLFSTSRRSVLVNCANEPLFKLLSPFTEWLSCPYPSRFKECFYCNISCHSDDDGNKKLNGIFMFMKSTVVQQRECESHFHETAFKLSMHLNATETFAYVCPSERQH